MVITCILFLENDFSFYSLKESTQIQKDPNYLMYKIECLYLRVLARVGPTYMWSLVGEHSKPF